MIASRNTILSALVPKAAASSSISPERCLRALSSSSASCAATSSNDTYDVVIVGGGMVGAAVAALLGSCRLTSQLRVAVLDVRPQPTTFQPRPVPDLRVSTVSPGSIEVLRRAGAWEQVADHSASFKDMQVWDTCSRGFIRWDARDVGEERMGGVAENTLLQSALLSAAERSAVNTRFVWPAEVRALRLPGGPEGADGEGASGAAGDHRIEHGLAELELADGRVLTSRLVVAADGASSRVRQMAGLRTWGRGYGQRGLVATVATSEPSSTAWQRFLPSGPLALLPVRDGFSNIVWSTTPEAARQMEGLGREEFADVVNRALRDPPAASPAGAPSLLAPLTSSLEQLGRQLGGPGAGRGYEEPPLVLGWEGGPPRSFPLQLKQAGRYTLPRLALVGDAAHAVHPLAGQGVNLGFGDAHVLAEAISAAVESGTDPGDTRLLYDKYEAPRRRTVMAMTAALDGIKAAFAVQHPGFSGLRGLGLQLINAVAPARNGIMQYAMMGQA